MKARIRFAKSGVMKYVGHLDLMRYFQKAIRRSGIPIKYSEGFHPHQIMSFAAPLGVGITSDGEYMDIELREFIEEDEAKTRLQETMVDGISIRSFGYLPEHSMNAMASLSAADYTLWLKHPEHDALSYEEVLKKKKEFFDDSDAIVITKKTKKSEREVDLKPLIYAFEIKRKEEELQFYLFVSTGSQENIKPELVLVHFFSYMGVDVDETSFFIHRHDMYTKVEDAFLSLEQVCEGKDVGDTKKYAT